MLIRINFCLLWPTQIRKQPEVEKASVFLQPRLVAATLGWHGDTHLGPTLYDQQETIDKRN